MDDEGYLSQGDQAPREEPQLGRELAFEFTGGHVEIIKQAKSALEPMRNSVVEAGALWSELEEQFKPGETPRSVRLSARTLQGLFESGNQDLFSIQSMVVSAMSQEVGNDVSAIIGMERFLPQSVEGKKSEEVEDWVVTLSRFDRIGEELRAVLYIQEGLTKRQSRASSMVEGFDKEAFEVTGAMRVRKKGYEEDPQEVRTARSFVADYGNLSRDVVKLIERGGKLIDYVRLNRATIETILGERWVGLADMVERISSLDLEKPNL